MWLRLQEPNQCNHSRILRMLLESCVTSADKPRHFFCGWFYTTVCSKKHTCSSISKRYACLIAAGPIKDKCVFAIAALAPVLYFLTKVLQVLGRGAKFLTVIARSDLTCPCAKRTGRFPFQEIRYFSLLGRFRCLSCPYN